MANHALVEWTLQTIAEGYTSAVVPIEDPLLIDKDDGRAYQIISGISARGGGKVGQAVVGTASVGETVSDRQPVGRKQSVDLTRHTTVSVSSSPDRDEQPVGTEYDLRVEDGVNILIEGAHEDEFGQAGTSEDFQRLVNEIRRVVLAQRTTPPGSRATRGADFCSAVPLNAGRPPDNGQTDYFAYTFDLQFRGYESLP